MESFDQLKVLAFTDLRQLRESLEEERCDIYDKHAATFRMPADDPEVVILRAEYAAKLSRLKVQIHRVNEAMQSKRPPRKRGGAR